MKYITVLYILLVLPFFSDAQSKSGYWNSNTRLTPWRFPVSTGVKHEDHDSDTLFEEKVRLKELGINDTAPLIRTAVMDFRDFSRLFRRMAEKQFEQALEASELARNLGINPDWYAFWMKPLPFMKNTSLDSG